MKNKKILKVDSEVKRILKEDGLSSGRTDLANIQVINIFDLMSNMQNDSSWYRTLVNTDSNSCTIINQMPGEGNRKHYHSDWNEWWLILRGEWDFEIDDEVLKIKEGDLVFIEKGKLHRITATGNKMATRLAVSRYDVDHIYPEE